MGSKSELQGKEEKVSVEYGTKNKEGGETEETDEMGRRRRRKRWRLYDAVVQDRRGPNMSYREEKRRYVKSTEC